MRFIFIILLPVKAAWSHDDDDDDDDDDVSNDDDDDYDDDDDDEASGQSPASAVAAVRTARGDSRTHFWPSAARRSRVLPLAST